MKKASPTTFRVGSLREFADWTRRVVRDPAAAEGVPKTWYDSEATARAAEHRPADAAAGAATEPSVSAEAMVKLLSANMPVLAAIRQHHPASVRVLAELTRRKEASLSRTLNNLAKAGIIAFRPGPGRTKMPVLVARSVHLDIDLTGRGSGVSVEADAA